MGHLLEVAAPLERGIWAAASFEELGERWLRGKGILRKVGAEDGEF